MRKTSISKSVSPQEMEYLRREEGLTNKQIAERCGCSEATVYRYIGKRSFAIANAQAQNKPCPVPEYIATGYEKKEVEHVMEQLPTSTVQDKAHEAQTSTLKTLKEVRIIQLQGSECQYEVNTGDKTVTVKNGAVEVIMFDLESLDRFIKELNEISTAYIR